MTNEITPAQSAIITQAIQLIQEARRRARIGEYGGEDSEYSDVSERFEEALRLLKSLL